MCGFCGIGVKEIDIAATLEHIRDQRPGMVRTKVTQPQNKLNKSHQCFYSSVQFKIHLYRANKQATLH